MSIKIDQEFKDYLGALDGEARQVLEDSLIAEGCRDALVIWPQPDGDAILLDGHNRHEICEILAIEYRVVNCPESVTDRQSALQWIVQNQRARRNLTPDQLRFLYGKLYKVEKLEQGGTGANQYKEQTRNFCISAPNQTTAERIGKEFGVSPRTVQNAAKFVDQVEEIAEKHGVAAKTEILAGRAKPRDYYTEDREARLSLKIEPGHDQGCNHLPIPECQEVPELIPDYNNLPQKVIRSPKENGRMYILGLADVQRILKELVELDKSDKTTLPIIIASLTDAKYLIDDITTKLVEGL